MTKNISKLQYFLKQTEIPKFQPQPKTFQNIAKQPHYENVLSNLYAFYFNCNEEHRMQELFIESLFQEIQKQKDFNFSGTEFNVTTEFSTIKGGRIDILISDEKNAIIIENKVFHHLNNDLEDYWKSVKQKNKIGIVLSLRKIKAISYRKFINITHEDLLKKVMQNIGKHMLSAKDKYIIFLKDLHQNITNLSSEIMDQQKIDFYLENQQKIIDIWKINNAMHEYILKQVELAYIEFEENNWLDGKKSERLRYFRSVENPLLMITIVIEELMTPKQEIWIGIELQGEELKRKEGIKQHFSENRSPILLKDFYNSTNTHHAHFAGKSYKLDKQEYQNLSQFIISKIKEDDFLEIYNNLNKVLSKQKKHHLIEQ